MTLEAKLEKMLAENQAMLRRVISNVARYQELAVRVDEAQQRQLDQLTSMHERLEAAHESLLKTLDRIDREQDERLTRLENLIDSFVRGSRNGNGRKRKH